jgi:ribosomal protein S18 acetylase RimI-like enzyme
MMTGVALEILDLRHFTASKLNSLLEAEAELWKRRLHWDYQASAKLLMQYLDSHMLPGYVALQSERVSGYVFCIYEENKAVIGDVFAMPQQESDAADGSGAANKSDAAGGYSSPHATEETLLRHLLELLLNSPQVDRIESQLLLHPTGTHSGLFHAAGFQIYPRLFMVQSLEGRWSQPQINLPPNLELRGWRDEDLAPASRLIAEAYSGHPDSFINDQYRSVSGSMRFLNNIVRHSGCGIFSAPVSHVVVERGSRELMALLLGSRVSPESGHITQICVHPAYRRRGLARMLLGLASYSFLRQNAAEISLTVTEANARAIQLYKDEGYTCAHVFDAAVWQRYGIA